jgi:hypothetical protein
VRNAGSSREPVDPLIDKEVLMSLGRSAFALLLVLVAAAFLGAAEPTEHGVYQYVLDPAQGTVDEIAAAIEAGASGSGWHVLVNDGCGTPAGCKYKARVLALCDLAYAHKLLAANARTGPFGIVDRVSVFEDEKGVHVAVLNPRSVLRTILMDDAKHAALAEEHLQALRALVAGAAQGTPSQRDFGEMREKGYIGKTMGVMAGGPFAEKIEDIAVVPNGDWRQVVDRVRSGLEKKGPKWGLHLAYALELPENEVAVLGSTGSPMDAKSFDIVKAGSDDARRSLQCPGIAHAAAYPIEIVVAKGAGVVRVRLVDTMFRMKMFFEDAGKWAFMKNMGMPGSIADEIKAQVKGSLGD